MIVRLKALHRRIRMRTLLSFNSMIVRLKAREHDWRTLALARFNSMIVRLKESFAIFFIT